MTAYTGILKGYGLLITYRDGSKFSRDDFEKQAAALNWVKENVDLVDTLQVSFFPVWSRLGESVPVKVHHQGEPRRLSDSPQA